MAVAHSLRMEGAPDDSQHVSIPSSSSSTSINGVGPSSSTSQVQQQQQEENVSQESEDSTFHHNHHHEGLQQRSSAVSYRVNISISDVATSEMRDDVWSCLVVLVTFWFFASMTLVLGFYGSVNLQLGPNCSRLIQTNPFFVRSIKVEEIDEQKPGPTLYGFYKPPPLDVEISWTETHDTFVPVNFHKEWIYFLNKGSKVDISYTVKSPSSSLLSLVIAKGRESLVEWVEDPSYPNTTLSWKIIHGSGKIQQEISKPSNYYIAVSNLNSEEVEVELKFTVKAFIYNTTKAYYRCSVGNHLCSLKLFLLRMHAAVLSSPGPQEVNLMYHMTRRAFFRLSVVNSTLPASVTFVAHIFAKDNTCLVSATSPMLIILVLAFYWEDIFIFHPNHSASGTINDDWHVKLSYGPRWITYFVGSGVMTALILLAFRFCNMLQTTSGDGTRFQPGQMGSERAPLLSHKDDDLSSWGSSYESVSHEEEDLEEWLTVSSLEGKPLKEGESNSNPRRLCVICFDAPRDCFFLPCGHCAACFTCGTRIAEEAGTCPICRRKMKKVRKIFTV